MKPDWKDAPEWANWLAMDEEGSWYWYETEPNIGYHTFFSGGRLEQATPMLLQWETTKESRP